MAYKDKIILIQKENKKSMIQQKKLFFCNAAFFSVQSDRIL